MLVAVNALENLIIRGVDMTFGTLVPFASMFAGIDWKILSVMIPIRRLPDACRMTIVAALWKISSDMVWISRHIIILLVTEIAVHRRACVAAGVTVDALRLFVFAR